jgi:membrane dipeptidase
MHLIVDAHQDMAYNALNFGRDYSLSALETRRREVASGSSAPNINGHCLLGLPEYLAGGVAVIFGTLFVAPVRAARAPLDVHYYADSHQAHNLYARQLDYYRRLADEHDAFSLVGSRSDLQAVLDSWAAASTTGAGSNDEALPDGRRVGLVPLMEGADAIREPEEAEWWQERGLRIVGLSWTGTRYAGGTGEPGPLTPDGRRLLDVLGGLGLILDLAHTSDESFLQALDRFEGVAICSHANPRALMQGFDLPERLLSDEMILRLAEAGGVIGVVPYNRFLKVGWQTGDPKASVPLERVTAMIDHICQLTGSAAHVGLGSDFDGGFGVERTPAEIDTIADLQKLDDSLSERGYGSDDIAAILGRNWIGVLQRGLPA